LSRDPRTTEELTPTPQAAGPGNGDGIFMTPGRRLREGRYVLERRLGHGGMASIWLARDERLGRPVAVKALSDTFAGDEEYMTRFEREAQVAARLSHPNLVNVYDYDSSGPRPFLVMEYIEGGDLGTRLAAGDAPDPKPLGAQLLAALRHIHAAGVLHRDVKPHNVLIDGDGRARLTDFGIAQPRDATALTRTGQVIGTERYLAPEVATGDGASERSDLYSVGVVLAEVAEAADVADAELWELIDSLRAPEAADRPGSAAAALAMLDRLRDGDGPRLPPTAPVAIPLPADEPEPTPPQGHPVAGPPAPVPPRRAGVIALVALGVALIAAIAIAAIGGDDDGGTPIRERASAEGDGNEQPSGGEEEQPAPDAGGGGEETAAEQDSAPQPDGVALNDEGYALVQAGEYDEAIPILQQAVDALAGSGDELTYNYALYNLALAYMGAGQPEDAIPLLEERMQFDDGQLAEVQATLDEALAAAGDSGGGTESDSSGEGGGSSGEGNSGNGNGPPPHAQSESGGTEADD
jgi:eukaryotic-like serine/threonine-protein kinase